MLAPPRLVAVAAAALLLVPTLAACAADGPFVVKETTTQTLEKPVASTGDLKVRVEMFNGPIEVRAGAAGTIHAVVETTGAGGSKAEAQSDAARIVVTLDVNTDGTVLLRATYQPNPGSPNNRSASAIVDVPAGAALDLRTYNGPVTTAGITGAIAAETSNGAVELAGNPAGATVRTSNALVQVEGGGTLDLQTSNGRISIRGTGATVRAATSNGDISFEGTFSTAPQHLDTSNNAITVRLPADASFALDAQTSNGRVTLDGFSIRTTGAASGSSLQGTVGTGGPSVTLRTTNAAIVISAQ